jgi:hypothetical protein
VEVFREHESLLETSSSFVNVPPSSAKFRNSTERHLVEVDEAQARIDQIVAEAINIDGGALQPVTPRSGLMRDVLTHPGDATSEWAARALSYLVGCAFGRWDVRIGRDLSVAPPTPDLFDPIPPCPPGMLVGADGFPVDAAPDAYPFEVPATGILVDEPGHAWEFERHVRRAAEAMFDDPDAILAEIMGNLGGKSLRDHLRRYFFKDHLARYSKSRRRAPLYWPLTTPSAGWGVWLYAPRLTRETLYTVASEASRRERLAADGIARLRREQDEGATRRRSRNLAEELDAEQKLAEELGRFRVEAERVAGLGWQPDANDGIVLCAAPLADLFPAWPDAKKARDELRHGDHEWAAVAQWAGEL